MIVIRADANNIIGMGHIMRCMSIGRQLHKLGVKVIFVISERYAESIIKTNGFDCICMENAYNDKENEIDKLSGILIENEAKILLIDSYEVTNKYFEELGKVVKSIYIDDINTFKYDVNVVLNYIPNYEIEEYKKWEYDMLKTEFWLGNYYIPLREEFGIIEFEVKLNAKSVLITTGGTDDFNMIISILKKMDEMNLQYLKKNVVVGKFYKFSEQLKEYADRNSNITIYRDVSNVWEIMRESDIAISAGGTTLSELCAIGVPTICFIIADNQIDIVKAYSNEGVMFNCGDVRKDKEFVVREIINEVNRLESDFMLRKKISDSMRNLVDGKGAIRIAEKIISCIE